MRLGGWTRLGIVLSAVYAVLIFSIAFSSRPRLENLQRDWLSEAAEVIAQAISKKEGQQVQAYSVSEALLKASNTENIAWLNKVATSPSEKQKVFSAAVGQVNEKYQRLIQDLPKQNLEYWGFAFAWWLGGTLILFGAGWTVGWIYRGFRRDTS